MDRHVNAISARLSLRPPQRKSLEILSRICEVIDLSKDVDVEDALEIISDEFPNVSGFERDFPSLCFALATGVGKTRLMGAFIAYLHATNGFKHFFVLAPNLTIYNKLIEDFTPNTPKYVLQGLPAFATTPPEIITGDNYESGRGVREEQRRQKSLPGTISPYDPIHINIFNISKINTEVRGGKAPRIKRLSEYIGDSYFNYLSDLKDLVLLMDESHRYRAQAGMNAINELKPVLGLELTATPQIETGAQTIPFKNVIYSYPLAQALEDGFVKEPTVATRENFNPKDYSGEQLEKIKLEDGVRIHESTKVDLETFAKQMDEKYVKPFMLIVARDTVHADELNRRIQSDEFFDGRYKERVITVHSNQRGAESDETVEKLLAIEDPNEPTEIVIHVNMLKEGWDVTNLYTIVPLRAANSKTLVEQSIGRGLRLPFGKKTGVKAVDRLTIVAHDKFQEIVDEANKPDSVLKIIPVFVEDIAGEKRKSVSSDPLLFKSLESTESEPTENKATQQRLSFETAEDRDVAKTVLKVIKRFENLPASKDLRTDEVRKTIAKEVRADLPVEVQAKFVELGEEPNIEEIVEKVTDEFVEMSIDIPRIIIQPKAETLWNYTPLTLDTSNLRLQPVAQHILLQELRTRTKDRLSDSGSFQTEFRLEDYIVKALIDFDDISYDDHADLLYDLSGQAVAHFKSYLKEDDVVGVLQHYQKRIASVIHNQMLEHQTQDEPEYEVSVTKGFSTLRSNNYTIEESEELRNFRSPVSNPSRIRSMHFGYFDKCLYPMQKFDADPERKFAVIIDDDKSVLKWFRPSAKQLLIYYQSESLYEPDFIVETTDQKLIVEVKREGFIDDEEVLAKAKAAREWCEHASVHEESVDGKPWKYLLIPHTAILPNASLDGLISAFTN